MRWCWRCLTDHHLPRAVPGPARAGAALHLLVHSTENPRSLGWVTRTLRERFAVVAPRGRPELAAEIAARLPEPTDWPLEMLSEPETHHLALTTRLRITAAAAQGLSNHISQQFFAHVVGTEQRGQ